MIPKFFKFAVVNNSGSLLSYDANGRINLKVTGFYIDPSTGKVTYSQYTDDDCQFVAASTLADGSETLSDEFNNSSNLHTGLLVQLEITHDEGTAAVGRFDLYFAGGDATGELPTDADGYDSAEKARLTPVGSLYWHSDGADDEVMRSDVFVVR